MVPLHNIVGTETNRRRHLLPGYAAFRLAPPQRLQWRRLAAVALTIAALSAGVLVTALRFA